jgi:Tle cognate immunity protein 4 C-terminal domain
MKFLKFSQATLVLALISTALLSGCKAAGVPADWKSECVGRMQFSLPQNVEVATSSLEDFESHYIEIGFDKSGGNANFQFLDKQIAINDNLMKIRFVSERLTPDEISKIRSQFWTSYTSSQIKAKKSNDPVLKNSEFKELVRGDKDMDAYSVRSYTEHLSVLDDHAVSYTLPNAALEPLDRDGNKIVSHQEFRANLRARKLFEVPSETGLCFPYVFLKDNREQEYRRVAAAYKLKAHPEITIIFTESAGFRGNDDVKPEREIMSNWSFYRDTDPVKSRVKMAERDGIAAFSGYTQNDDTKDFGYFAYVRGNDKAALDTPTLELKIFRDSKYAKGTPMGKEEFKLMAEQIIASVKYRSPGPMANPPRKLEPEPTPLPKLPPDINDAAKPATGIPKK